MTEQLFARLSELSLSDAEVYGGKAARLGVLLG